MKSYPHGTILSDNLYLSETRTAIPRLFVIDDGNTAYPIYPGHNITVAETLDDGQRAYVTHMPLAPSRENDLEGNHYISFQSRFTLRDDELVSSVGELSSDEQRLFDTYRDIYEQRGYTQEKPIQHMEAQLLGQRSLYHSIKQDDHQEVKRLLDSGVTPNPEGMDNQPLHAAATFHAKRSAHELLAHGANVNALNWSLKSALDLAIQSNDVQMADTLITHGADPDLSIGDENVFAYSREMKNVLSKTADNLSSHAELAMETPVSRPVMRGRRA